MTRAELSRVSPDTTLSSVISRRSWGLMHLLVVVASFRRWFGTASTAMEIAVFERSRCMDVMLWRYAKTSSLRNHGKVY